MNKLGTISSLLVRQTKMNSSISFNSIRKISEETPRISLEKSVNHVTLLGRVGINPQLRGSESKPVVVFTLATNTNYRYESGEIQQKTDWHRVSVFKPSLRDTVLEHLKQGSRVYIEGRILYGEFSDANGIVHNTTSIVANELIFLGHSQRKMEEMEGEIEQ